MKHIILCLIAGIMMAVPAWGRSLPGDKVGVTFAETVHEFGNVAEDGGPVTCRFDITNNSSEAVAIVSVVASCGCTKPQYSKKPILPGKKGTIEVTYRPKGQKGEFDKEVKVKLKSGSGKEERVKLRITGVVVP